MSGALQLLDDFEKVSISEWDIEKWLAKDWNLFPADLSQTDLAVEIFALSEDHCYGSPLRAEYHKDSGGRLTKSIFDFRRIGYPEDWLEDSLFYGRGNLLAGNVWLDHARHTVSRVNYSKKKFNTDGTPYFDIEEHFSATTYFWYKQVLDCDITLEDRKSTPCHETCEVCYRHRKGSVPFPNYVITAIYDKTGENIQENHWGLPYHGFRARPTKIWTNQIRFRYVYGRKIEKDNVAVKQENTLIPKYSQVKPTTLVKKPKPKRKAAVLLDDSESDTENDIVFNIDIEKEFV